ncbi:MAG: hypothetical protein K8S97_06300, partial [Anaerolineae bacterium]|nr:hypothetical protein [Anaerolineae bacterium]
MAKRLLDLLIVLIVLAAIGVGGYFGYTTFIADDESSDDNASTSGTAQITDSTLELPRLTQTQFLSLLLAPEDLPAPYSQAQNVEPFIPEDLSVTERELATEIGADASLRFSTIRSTYNWQPDYAIEFSTCTLGQDVAAIGVEISQLASSADARAFIDDPLVRGFFQAIGYTLTEADAVHGWYLTPTTPFEGDCFAQGEWNTGIFFEYWGMLFLTSVKVSADASPDLGHAISLDLTQQLMQGVEALDVMTGINIPPTPVPPGMTFEQLITADLDAVNLTFMIPSSARWTTLYNNYTSDPDESLSVTLAELIDFYRTAGTAAASQLAGEIDHTGRRMGLIAREVRVFKPDTDCPNDEPARIDVTVSLFERPTGAIAYMQDAGIQAAWRGTGLFNTF